MKSTKPLLIVVLGPTASGKTDLAVALAKHYSTEIISADSRQIYKGMAIGTAQPDKEQTQSIKHHFIDELQPEEEYTCGRFADEGLHVLDSIFSTHSHAVMVGGSGLYIDALINGLDDLPLRDDNLRNVLSRQLAESGIESLLIELKKLDKDYYEVVDKNNPARVLRAIEVCRLSGRPYSAQRKHSTAERPFDTVKIGLDIPRDILYERINRRVDMMLENGLEQEARKLYPKRQLNSLQTVGYRELFDYFDGKTSYAEAIELIKRNTRRYAKRQLTWFRRDTDIRWFAPDETAQIIGYINEK